MVKKEIVYSKAFKEVNEIIKFFPRSEYEKISKYFINFIEENMNNDYNYIVKHIDDLQNQEMLEETKIMLAIIYREFIASNEGRKQIYETEKLEIIQEEKRNFEKYNPEGLFKKQNDKEKSDEVSENMQIIEHKPQNLFYRILNKLVDFFKGK